MVVRAAYRLFDLGLALARDRRGSNTVEFVISIPILLAVLVLSTEYGKVLHRRTVLDGAVADAARYLSRVPFDPDLPEDNFPTEAVQEAHNIIRFRFHPEERGDIEIGEYEIESRTLDSGVEIEFVRLSATKVISSPALSVLNIARPETTKVNGRDVSSGITIDASETYRYYGR